MRRLEASDLKNNNVLKHYRIIRRWACRNNNLADADLELLIYFDCLEFFTKQDYKIGTYAYSWDNKRWNNLLKEWNGKAPGKVGVFLSEYGEQMVKDGIAARNDGSRYDVVSIH